MRISFFSELLTPFPIRLRVVLTRRYRSILRLNHKVRKAKRLSYRVVVALAPDVLLRASYPLERITSCQMIHHLRHHTSPPFSLISKSKILP